MEFWNPWQLWVKMTFVLACAIVIVVGAGICKLIWMHRNLQKHIKILQEKQAEQKALLARPSVRERRRKQEIPFGIRAIESGVEVEGVWISRPTSAATSRVASPVISGTTTPASPHEYGRPGTETPVSGAARVLASRRRPSASRTASDPFRDSRAITLDSLSSRGRGPESSSSESTTYHDLPDAEAGYSNVRMPSNQSLKTAPQQATHGLVGKTSQPAFYRPTGTPDPHLRARNSYIPRHLQSRALGPGSYPVDESSYKSSPTDDEMDASTSHAYGRAGRTEGSALLPKSPPNELSFVAPAGMMPQVAGQPSPWHASGRRQRSYHDEVSPDTDPEREHAAASFQSFVDSDPRHGYRRSRMPSHEEEQRARSRPEPASASSATSYPQASTRTPSGYPVYQRQQQQDRSSTATTAKTTSTAASASFATRAEAEAARSDMRRVNDGFSVSRHGVRRNRESLIAEAQELRDERERRERDKAPTANVVRDASGQQQQQQQQSESVGYSSDRGDGATAGRRKLQKKRASTALATAEQQQQQQQQQRQAASSSSNARAARKTGRTSSQFKEHM